MNEQKERFIDMLKKLTTNQIEYLYYIGINLFLPDEKPISCESNLESSFASQR